jgi:hypothetical protein
LGKDVQDLATIIGQDQQESHGYPRVNALILMVGGGFLVMCVRTAVVATVVLAAGSALAEPMNATSARRFVVGKIFAYNCFDGTRGAGRIQSDLSVAGTIQIRGTGPVRFVTLPPGTLRVRGENVCASLRGIPFEPCFNLNKTNLHSFRGSVQGFGFAYCDFTRRIQRRPSVRTTWRHAKHPQPSATRALAEAARAGN